jgi:hypothetical protein
MGKIKRAKGETARVEALWLKACTEASKVAKFAYDEGIVSLSGYTAHAEIGRYGGIHINGKGEDGHEDFLLRERFKKAKEQWGFCKTAQKPYDLVVTAMLAVIEHYMGPELFSVSSDGWLDEWVNGVNLARVVLEIEVGLPIGLEARPAPRLQLVD